MLYECCFKFHRLLPLQFLPSCDALDLVCFHHHARQFWHPAEDDVQTHFYFPFRHLRSDTVGLRQPGFVNLRSMFNSEIGRIETDGTCDCSRNLCGNSANAIFARNSWSISNDLRACPGDDLWTIEVEE